VTFNYTKNYHKIHHKIIIKIHHTSTETLKQKIMKIKI